MFGTPGLDERAAILRHIPHEDRLSPLGTPNEVVDDEVDSVFVASVFHVGSIPTADMEYKCPVAKNNGLKPEDEKPASPLPLKWRGLRRVHAVKALTVEP
jgi:hypothetical protein